MKTSNLHCGWGRFAVLAGALLVLAPCAPARAADLVGAVGAGGDRVVQLAGDSHDIVHTFTRSGTFTLSEPVEVRYLVVGGGGAGGANTGTGGNAAGGGGAGGFVPGTTNLAAGTYAITVGEGGATLGADGAPSSIAGSGGFAITALGGGGGGKGNEAGRPGGSGGGGGACQENTGTRAGGAGAEGQGNPGGAGGKGIGSSGLDTVGGGGGGAGAAGECSNLDSSRHGNVNSFAAGWHNKRFHAGNGGDGLPSDITGEEVWYAGGGGGGTYRAGFYMCFGGDGGRGGGGHGSTHEGPQSTIDGAPGTGGGGGGQSRPTWKDDIVTDQRWGKGGSGVVILRYAPQGDVVGLEPIEPEPRATSVVVRAWASGSAAAAKVLWGSDPADLANEAAVSGGEATLAPLVPGATYYARAAGGAVAGPVVPFRAEDWPEIETSGATLGRLESEMVATFGRGGSFAVAAPATVRLLAVGGGGGGGFNAGAGGGAGGLVETNLVLAAGTYTVAVGAGGAAATDTNTHGSRGGDTVLARIEGDETNEIVRAFGGGGGASWDAATDANQPLLCGGSGGGTTRRGTPGYAVDAAQGHGGGPFGSESDDLGQGGPSGGGGAGGPGDFIVPNGTKTGGAGGPGRASDITGESLVYAAGGGGGSRKSTSMEAGAGGDEGSGHGTRLNSTARTGDEDGLDGRGGGGGGGNGGGTVAGGRGGSGVLVLRFARDPDAPTIVDAAVLEDILRLDVSLACSLDGATVSYRLAAAGEDVAAAPPVVLTASSTADEPICFSLTNLVGDAVYAILLEAAKDGHRALPVRLTASPFAADPAFTPSVAANDARTRAGADEVHVLRSSGTFTLATRRRVRLLAVGGGGGSGWGSSGGGAGGGAGGMLEETNVLFRPGTYVYEVGAGGEPGRTDASKGGNGGDTTLYYVDPATFATSLVARAYGGGGSGCWNDRSGLAGGSGGGAVYRGGNEWGSGGSVVGDQGHAGGGWTTKPDTTVGSSGGGGAGAAGQAGTAEGGGDGGDGLPCDITGAEVWYAGGGGASRRNAPGWSRVGRGGRGGGGDGTDVGQTTGTPSHDGVDGLGGGGGGGLAWEWRSNTYIDCFGGRGGSGTLILRFAAPPQATPELASASVAMADRTTATFSGLVEDVGEGAASASLVLALDGVSETVATGLAPGDSFSIDRSVERGASVAWSLKLVNDRSVESAAVSGTLAVPADGPVAIETTGASRVFDVAGDTVAVFTNTASSGSLVVPAGGAWVELLLVGGGGAGGYAWDSHPASGGGAGGFVHETARFLEAGTYTITVGAGGKGREDGVKTTSYGAGNPGQPSILSRDGTEILKAWGGGGGAGSYGSVKDTAGASSAGAMPRSTQSYGWLTQPAVEPSVPGQGHRGGTGYAATITNASGSATQRFSGGGGGAGAPGGDGDPVAQTFGAGGDGLPCSITGEEVWYAGGGGCGAAYRAPGSRIASATAGGRGGGGHGQRWQAAIDPDNRGVDGLGGGGGSGGNNSGNSDNVSSAGPGHSGGCGTVIVRWRRLAPGAIAVAPDEPVAGFRRGSFSGTVVSAGGEGATVDIEIGLVANGSTATNWTPVATGLAAGEAYSAAIDGLADGTAYSAVWRATGGAGGAVATGDAGSFATIAGAYLVPGADAAGATITRVGADSVYTYSNSATAGTFTVDRAGYARVLLAGGGGAGGWYRGGGGGGGGVIEEELVWLEAGTYAVTIGAGGASPTSSGQRGGNGGDTVVSLGGAELWRAYGGGGGGSWNDNGVLNLGADGGSGGGSARRRETTAGNPIDPAQGNPGAPSRRRNLGNNEDYWSAGGGGGAGSPGLQASTDHTIAGAGGAGRPSDISGTVQQYGAGGGAACTDIDENAAGEGGDGIGGHGRRNEYTTYWFGDEPGRAGYGGGGGGGAVRDWNSSFIRPGAPGGCGTVVIRFATEPADHLPDAFVVASSPSASDPTAADVEIRVRSLGDADAATLELAYGASRDNLPLRRAVGAVAAPGTIDATLPGLEPGRTYYVAAAIRTAAGETVTRAVEVSIPAAGAAAGDGSYGLWQAPWGASATDRDPGIWDSVSTKSVVSGAIAAIGRGEATDPLTGASWPWASSPFMFLYRGYAFLKGGTTYTFGSRMNDSIYLAIGGTALLDTRDEPAHSAFAEFTAPHTGWYPVDARIGNASGSLNDRGPDGDGVDSWQSFSLAYNTEGSRAMMPESAWSLLLDPGDGSFLRPEDPGLRYADLDVNVEAQNRLRVAAAVAPGIETVRAYLCYGPSWGGNDPTTGWATTIDLGEAAAAAPATTLAEVQVPNWGTSALVAAVALVHPDGTTTWSEPVTYAGTSLLSLSAAASDWSQGDELEVSFAIAGGTAPYRAELWVGNGPANLRAAATATGLAAGTHTLRATGLTPGLKYYWKVVVTDAAGASAATDDSANVSLPAGAVYLDEAAGIWWSISQRTATLGGGLKALGAGDNWALLRLYEDPYLVWGENTRSFRDSTTNSGDRALLAETGLFSITREFPWESQIGFAWIVSNANGRQTWSTPLMPKYDGSAADRGTFWVGDNQTYTWAGGAGDWNDAAKWTPDGTKEGLDQNGFPIIGSYASFPAGEHVVDIPAGGTKVENGVPVFRPTTLKLQKGAKVTLRGTPESARLDLKHINPPLRQGNISLAEGAELVVSGVKGTWNPQRENGSSVYFSGPNTLFEVTDGSEISIGGNGVGQWTMHSWDGSRDGRRIVFSKGSKTTVCGQMLLAGRQELVVDDATVVMEANSGDWQYSRIHFGFVSPGRFVLRGAHPLVVANNSISVDAGTNPSSDAEQYIDFEIPAGGFAEAPIRCRAGNTTYLFGRDASESRRMVLRVPADSPAASAKGVLVQPLVWWPAGKTEGTILSPDYLPHPDTDGWYETHDPVTGAFTGWGVRIVGRPDVEEPQIVGLAMTNIVSGSADFEFYGIPGTNATTATFSATIERTDLPGDTSASVALAGGTAGSVSQGARLTIAATGLAEGGVYRVTVTGADDGDPSLACTETLVFNALADYAEASTSSAGATAAQIGPETVWTFTDTENEGVLSVTRAGTARILVVGGGGGGGGADSADTNESNPRRGGGGGGGGEVVETEVYLQPGEYFVTVGAGGASVGTWTVGKAGGYSTFAGLVTAYGGGGGGARTKRNNTDGQYVDPGANGGGAAGGGAVGGAATAVGGHAGGVSTYNAWANWNDIYAGAGGGAMGGVGGDAGLDALNMIAPGNGADGVPSDITGETLWYGGGGGGGGAGLAFGPGIGGLGGKGGGGEGRSRWTCTAFALESSHGADGFGGGGGGGSSGGKDTRCPDALQAYYGGRGGSGAVIVRMRTATARTSDPQISLRSAEPAAGGVDLAVNVHSLGNGEPSADLLFVCAADGGTAATTNALGTVSATGVASFSAGGLRPGTDYAGAVVATNAAGGVASVSVPFRTADESHGDADSGIVAGSWTLESWDGKDTSLFSDNLLRASNGGFVRRAQNRRKSGWGPATNNQGGWEEDMIDGIMNRTNGRYVGYGTNELLAFTLSAPSAVSSMRFFSGWGATDGWTPIAIEGIDVRSAENEPWTALANSAYQGALTGTWGSFATLDAGGNDWLARDVRQIRVRFDRNLAKNHDGTIYWEIEAHGAAEADAPALHARAGRSRPLEAGPTFRVADGISGSVSIPAGEPAFDGVFAVWGAAHGGEDTNGWAHVLSFGPVGTGAAAFPLSLSDAELGDAAYVRFVGFGEDGTVSWSDSVYVPDVEPADDRPPAVVAGACDAGTTTADITAVLVFAGAGATDGRADIHLQYSALPGAFDGLEGAWTGPERLLAAGVSAGSTNLAATGLRPGRIYAARLVARNAAGEEGVSEPFEISTAVEDDATGGTWGLRQAEFTDFEAFGTKDYPAVPADADAVEGVIMADTTRYATSAKNGETYDWGDQRQSVGFAYAGAIFLEADRTYTFGENFDDGVRIEIDGEQALDDRDYRNASYADYVCTNAGWHLFRLWLFQDYGGVGWQNARFDNHSVAWNTNGVRSTGANAAWHDFIDRDGGAFLRSVFPRTPVVDGFERDGDALVLTVSVPVSDVSCALYAVWGAAYGGADESAWEHSDLVEGEVSAEAQTLSFRIADASEAPIVRFYTKDAAGAAAWSESVHPDLSVPSVRDAGVTHAGDRATVTANLLSAGAGELVLVVQWADNPAMENARSQAIATSGPGSYSATIEVEPGATTWYRFVARNRGGAADATMPASFATRAGSRLDTSATSSGLSHHTVTLNGSLATLGAGTTTVYVYAGTDPDALEPIDSRAIAATGAFSFPETFRGEPHQVWFAFRSVNSGAGGTTWESWSSTNSLTTVDGLTYTWRQDVAEGAWNNPSNWIPSASADDCIGYPCTVNSTVDFADGTVAVVTVPGKYRFSYWNVARSHLDITFVGLGPDVSSLGNNNDNIGGGTWKNSSLTFSNLSLAEKDGIYFGDPSRPADSRNSTLRFTDGAVASFGNAITAAGSNMWLVVDGGATLSFRDGGPALAVKDGGVRLDGGTIDGKVLYTDYNWSQTTNQTILVSGDAPRIGLATAFRNESAGAASLQNADTAFLFTVPKTGWAAPAIYSESQSEAFGAMKGDGPGRYVLSLDPASPAFKRAGTHTVQLIAWRGGVDTNHVSLAPAPEGAEILWTYGWPSTATAPAAAGDAPTGVRAVVHGTNLSVYSVEAAEGGVLATVSLDTFDEGVESADVSIQVASSPDGFDAPDLAFAFAGNPVAEPGEFGILATNLVPATPYWVRAAVAPAGGGEASYSAVRPFATAGEGRMAYSGAGGTFLSAQATLSAAGIGSSGAKARLEASFAADFAALSAASREVRVDDGATALLTVEDLVPATNYWLRVRFTNDRGFVFYATDSVARATYADPIDRGVVFVPGLVQARMPGGSNWTTDVWTHATAAHVPGMLMALTTSSAVNPYDGKTYSWGDNQTWGYVGQMWMDGGRTYWFARNIDDRTYAKIDGDVVFGDKSTASFTPSGTGWHDVDFRAGNDGGGHGPNNGTIGFGWNADGISSFTTETFQDGGPWTKAMDPGDGTVLRVVYSETPFLSISSVGVADGVLSVTASFADIPAGAASFEAFFGVEDVGIDEGRWDGHAVVASPLPGDTASATYEVPGAGDAAYVIFRLCGTDTRFAPWRQWSRVYRIAPGRPSFRLENTLVAFTNLGWTAICTGIGAGASTVSAEVQLSTEPDFSVTNQTVPFAYDGVGASDAAFAGLETNKVYYARVAGVNDRGEWGYSRTLSCRTLLPGPPVATILSDFSGFMSGSWYASVTDFGFGGESAFVWIEVSESGEFDDTLVFGGEEVEAVPFTTAESVFATGLRPATTYRVRSRARNAWGVEGVSAAIDFATRAEPFVMTDVGSIAGETGRTTLTIECIQIEEGAAYSVSFAVDGSTLKTYANRTGLGTYTAVYLGDPGSTHRCVVTVSSRFGGPLYSRTYEASFTIGENAYAIGSLADLRAIPMRVGDKLVLPALAAAEDHYELLGCRPFEILEDGRTIRALEPGFVAVAAFQYDPLQDAVVRTDPMGLAVCVPEPVGNGRVFLARRNAGGWNWAQPGNWRNLTDPADIDSWPCLPDDVAIAPMANGQALAVDADATVGQLYFGFDEGGIPGVTANSTESGVRLAGANGATLTFESTLGRTPALLRFCNLGNHDATAGDPRPRVYIGNNGTGGKILAIRLGSDLEWDAGSYPDYTDTARRNRFGRYRCGTENGRFWEVPEGRTLHMVNFTGYKNAGDDQGGFASVWLSGNFPFTGGGTVVYEGPASTCVDNAFIPFRGTLVVRNKQLYDTFTLPSNRRGGGFWMPHYTKSSSYVMTNTALVVEGFVGHDSGIDPQRTCGIVTWGNTHGYPYQAPCSNAIPQRCVTLSGGYMLLWGIASSWEAPATIQNQSDLLVVSNGFSVISLGNSTPTNQMLFHAVEHPGKGTLYCGDDNIWNSGGANTYRARTVLEGISAHAIGGNGRAGAYPDGANDPDAPIVPWIVTAVGSGNSVYFPSFTDEGVVRQKGHPAATNLADFASATVNARCHGHSLSIPADWTVNSLWIGKNATAEKCSLGEGRTLVLTSGGLILGSDDKAMLESEATAKNGTRGTVVFGDTAYVYSVRRNASDPNEIWARCIAPKGFALSYPGYLRLGGDQTGIDDEIVVNGSNLILGSAEVPAKIDVPVRLVGANASLSIAAPGSFCRRGLTIEDHVGNLAGSLGAKFIPAAGTVEKLGLTYINGVNLRKGTYGSSESGADHIDDNHFSGTGVAQVCVDETDKATMLILK